MAKTSSEDWVLGVILVGLGIAGVVAIGRCVAITTPADKARVLKEIAPRATIPEGYEIGLGVRLDQGGLVIMGRAGTDTEPFDRWTLIVLATVDARDPQAIVELALSIAKGGGYQHHGPRQSLPITTSLSAAVASLEKRPVTYDGSSQEGIEYAAAFRIDADRHGLLIVVGPDTRFDRAAVDAFLESVK